MPHDTLHKATRRFECVCMALNGKTVAEIARKLRLSTLRVQGMIEQQAGKDFYPQLTLERRKRKARYLGFMKIEEKVKGGELREGLGNSPPARRTRR